MTDKPTMPEQNKPADLPTGETDAQRRDRLTCELPPLRCREPLDEDEWLMYGRFL